MVRRDPYVLIESILRQDCRIQGIISPESRLRDELGLDSVGMLTLMVGLEDALQTSLPEPPEPVPETVRQLADFLETYAFFL